MRKSETVFHFRKSLDGSQRCLRSGAGFSEEQATRRVHSCFFSSLFYFGGILCTSLDVFRWRGTCCDDRITFLFTGIYWCGSRKSSASVIKSKLPSMQQLMKDFCRINWKQNLNNMFFFNIVGWLLIEETPATFQSTPTHIIKRSSRFRTSTNGRKELATQSCRDCVTAADA